MGWQTQLSNLKHIGVIAICLFLAGCAVPGNYFTTANMGHSVKIHNKSVPFPIVKITPDNLPKYEEGEYHIGRHDVLSVVVWQHPNLTTGNSSSVSNDVGDQGDYTQSNVSRPGILVNNDGNIFFPYAGNVHVSGKTTSQVSDIISDKLSEYIREPQVSVRVSQFRSQKAYMLGEVSSENTIALDDRPTDVLSAINDAGGLAHGANSANIFVFRWDDGHPKIYWLSLGSPLGMLLAQHFVLQDRDILYVAPAGLANWNRIISAVTPTLHQAWGGGYSL